MKKFICLILSLLMILPSLCLTSCDSANVGDPDGDPDGGVGGLSTDETQKKDENKTPLYTAPAEYKELAKSDKVYRSGIYTGYSVLIRNSIEDEYGQILGYNLNEVMLDYPGEALPVHEDPTCSHESMRCPTSAEMMSKAFLTADRDDGLPIVFYFGDYWNTAYSEEGGEETPAKICEVRGYDVGTGEYTTVAKSALTGVDSAILYKGKFYITGLGGSRFGMVDILTGESKIVEDEDYYSDYNVLGIINDRVYYMYAFGEQTTEEEPIKKNDLALRSCSLDLDDVRVEYDFGDLGEDFYLFSRGYTIDGRPRVISHYGLSMDYSYIEGGVLYFPKAARYAFAPQDYYSSDEYPENYAFYVSGDFIVYDIYALDLNDMSAGEKLILKDVYKFAAKNGKLYYTLADYEEVGEISSGTGDFVLDENGVGEIVSGDIQMFASTDGGTLYEYDTATGTTREVCRDSGYNMIGIYEVTDDGKLFFDGRDYVNFVRADEGNYSGPYTVGRKEYCMLDLSSGEVTELYAPLTLREPGVITSYS